MDPSWRVSAYLGACAHRILECQGGGMDLKDHLLVLLPGMSTSLRGSGERGG